MYEWLEELTGMVARDVLIYSENRIGECGSMIYVESVSAAQYATW